ncbi:MAG: EcsC family protein, partial [Bacteroidota bacterium]|nr:EcsC family protein [Bacteroidota bacterium]
MLQPVYEEQVLHELKAWQKQMLRSPSLANRLAKRAQEKINVLIPEKVHLVITATIKQMIRAALFGAEFTTRTPTFNHTLEVRETLIRDRIEFYKKTAAAEGGITGAGGILLGFADFPLLLGFKLKMLYDIAALYGHNISDYKERLYLLYIFQLTFSSQQQRTHIYKQMVNWEVQKHQLPDDI